MSSPHRASSTIITFYTQLAPTCCVDSATAKRPPRVMKPPSSWPPTIASVASSNAASAKCDLCRNKAKLFSHKKHKVSLRWSFPSCAFLWLIFLGAGAVPVHRREALLDLFRCDVFLVRGH